MAGAEEADDELEGIAEEVVGTGSSTGALELMGLAGVDEIAGAEGVRLGGPAGDED